jgi:hypothetical protein
MGAYGMKERSLSLAELVENQIGLIRCIEGGHSQDLKSRLRRGTVVVRTLSGASKYK